MPQRVRARMSWERMEPDSMSFDNPFLRWFAAHHSRGAATAIRRKDAEGVDITMGPAASRRISVGMDDDFSVLLGMEHHEQEIFSTLRWVDGALLRRTRGGDWIVLRTPDIRTDEPMSPDPIPARLWLPVQPNLITMFRDVEPPVMKLVRTDIREGKALLTPDPPWLEIPILKKGRWENE